MTKLEKTIINLYTCGKGMVVIARLLQITMSKVNWTLSKYGIPKRSYLCAAKTYSCDNSRAFHGDNLTKDAAYWCGIIATDGCIFKPKRSKMNLILGLTVGDIEHIQKFKDFLQTDHKISVSKPGVSFKINGKEFERNQMAEIRVANQTLCDDLITLGITPRKTHSLKVSEILEKSRHFWRGAIDGDGCIYGSGNKFSIELAGTQMFMEQFSRYLLETLNIVTKVHKHKSIYRVRLKSKPAELAISHLYKNTDLYLERKFRKIIELRSVCRCMSKDIQLLSDNIGEGHLRG